MEISQGGFLVGIVDSRLPKAVEDVFRDEVGAHATVIGTVAGSCDAQIMQIFMYCVSPNNLVATCGNGSEPKLTGYIDNSGCLFPPEIIDDLGLPDLILLQSVRSVLHVGNSQHTTHVLQDKLRTSRLPNR